MPSKNLIHKAEVSCGVLPIEVRFLMISDQIHCVKALLQKSKVYTGKVNMISVYNYRILDAQQEKDAIVMLQEELWDY